MKCLLGHSRLIAIRIFLILVYFSILVILVLQFFKFQKIPMKYFVGMHYQFKVKNRAHMKVF